MNSSNFGMWYALHVRSRHEKSVNSQLEVKRYETLLPLYTERKRWADRFKEVSLPLFPGYVFCRFPLQHRSAVVSTSGVIDLVRIGQDPAPVSDLEIDAIRRIGESGLPVEPYENLVVGDRVTLTYGALSGLSGVLRSVRNRLRLVVSVELLCRSVMVEVDQDMVEPFSPGLNHATREFASWA